RGRDVLPFGVRERLPMQRRRRGDAEHEHTQPRSHETTKKKPYEIFFVCSCLGGCILHRAVHRSCPPLGLFIAAGGVTRHNGQPMTLSFFVRWRCSRRLAISAWNCSSLSATRMPRSMNMFATERLPEPCQLRGSGTFLLVGELSMKP